jgi:hypothetical protein
MKNKSKNSEPDNSRRGPDAIGGTVNLVTKTGTPHAVFIWSRWFYAHH